ncbi:methyltransferase [Pseudidiomarina aestuarii]|uniref:Methyltransferase n=2 Tax=Pseudidiomarina aestuarii TaxID=624146 RepID=A0A2T4CXE4_9GAMM|nr:methyltransferase [Pseudidiomarina aestuarii]PTB89115.1 methyltransferase [Pseudidiomarina aestuarii]
MNKFALSSVFALSALAAACSEAPQQTEAPQEPTAAVEEQAMQEEMMTETAGLTLADVAASDLRSDSNKARDAFRHPVETLEFFGLEPDMTVVEIWPGGGWYTEILAPYLKDQGMLYAAHFPADSSSDYFNRSRTAFAERIASDDAFSAITMTEFNATAATEVAPAGSADMVLTFRNLHNWYMAAGEEGLQTAFSTFYTALKPGGVLGVVDHRLPEDRPDEEMSSSGYMKESVAIAMAEAAGFELVGSSPINANEMDTADHPRGVWTLPPSLRLGDEDREKYLAIGESDRFTLKFMKPTTTQE